MDNRELEKRIGYTFKNKKLLIEALTHSSYANERQDGTRCNERLEFLGDSVLGFISAEHFFHHFKHLPEGELTKRRAYFVCEKSLSEFARTLGIGEFLLFGKGEVLTGGKDRPSILADAFEAVLAAIYLDGGIEPAKKFVFRFIDKADEEKPETLVTEFEVPADILYFDGFADSSEEELKALDHLTLVGSKAAISKAVKKLGYVKDTGTETDISFISIGLVVGLLIGAISFVVSKIPITLGSGGGALIGGLLFGYYQDRHSNYGLMPKATRWFCKSVGLNLFIAIVGLTSGASFISALQSMGLKVLLIGILVTILPHIASVYFGRFVLKLDAVDIIGALCGAGTCTAALNGVVEECDSSIFAIAYTPGYAMGNILLTVLGPLVVAICIH